MTNSNFCENFLFFPKELPLIYYLNHCNSNEPMWYKLYLLTGLLLVAVSLYKLRQSVEFIGSSERAQGTVVSLDESDGAYAPVFSIMTNENVELIYHHAAYSSPSSWDVGEKATFLYDPANLDSVRMMGYFWLFNWAIILMAIAIPLIITGAGYLLLSPLTGKEGKKFT
ncbi:DUF3592 domain-containing protein [Chitinophaga qingshengii]|uniref:DUF3592 domain-containing protein n=1 Tax=Chitinophaga qingshengii TaxID=1569794 RepID=A0ABR7TQH1_9BACT|nr:DUF3592 domain-containing protein [Chitinophaga qingshengii]MBC9932723.1 DUF3592 domain-containing protein [Chitinophaga qingshengii]